MTPFESAPEEFDQTIFLVNSERSIGPAEGLALNVVKDAQRYLSIFVVCSLSPFFLFLSLDGS